MSTVPPDVEARFWSKVNKGSLVDCWLWTAAKTKFGHGVMGKGKRGEGLYKAHRLSWIIHNGPIPKMLCVCHVCDIPSCVNPRHLFLGTQQDNIMDAVEKGRQTGSPGLPGESNPFSKLTKSQVEEIRTSSVSSRKLAAIYGVGKSQILRIKNGVAWNQT